MPAFAGRLYSSTLAGKIHQHNYLSIPPFGLSAVPASIGGWKEEDETARTTSHYQRAPAKDAKTTPRGYKDCTAEGAESAERGKSNDQTAKAPRSAEYSKSVSTGEPQRHKRALIVGGTIGRRRAWNAEGAGAARLDDRKSRK